MKAFPVTCCANCPLAAFNYGQGVTCAKTKARQQVGSCYLPTSCPLWHEDEVAIIPEGGLLTITRSSMAEVDPALTRVAA